MFQGIALWVMVIFFIVLVKFASTSAQEKATTEKLGQFVAAEQISSPVMLSSDISLDSISSNQLTLIYRNTIHTPIKEVNAAALKKSASSNFLSSACTKPEVNELLIDGVSIQYDYRHISGAELAKFNFTEEDCA